MLLWEEKKVIIFLFSIVGTFRQKEYWKYFSLTSKQQQNIDAIVKNCEELLVDMRMDEKNYDTLVRDIKRGVYKIECLHNRELEDRRKHAKKQPIVVREEDLYSLVEHAMDTHCNNCTRNPKACGLRKTLRKMTIIEVDPDKVDGCEYCVKKGGTK